MDNNVGMFDLEPSHILCDKCPFMDIELEEVTYFDGETLANIQKPKCIHREACERAFEKFKSANLSCPTVKE